MSATKSQRKPRLFSFLPVLNRTQNPHTDTSRYKDASLMLVSRLVLQGIQSPLLAQEVLVQKRFLIFPAQYLLPIIHFSLLVSGPIFAMASDTDRIKFAKYYFTATLLEPLEEDTEVATWIAEIQQQDEKKVLEKLADDVASTPSGCQARSELRKLVEYIDEGVFSSTTSDKSIVPLLGCTAADSHSRN